MVIILIFFTVNNKNATQKDSRGSVGLFFPFRHIAQDLNIKYLIIACWLKKE